MPILVLTLAPDRHHHGPVHIARSAGRLGIRVYGVHDDRLAPAALSRYMKGRLIVPRTASEDEWLINLQRFGRKLGRAVLVPIDDAGATFVDEHADTLSEHFLFPRRRTEINTILGSKRELHLLALRVGINSPAAAFPQDEAEAVEDAKRLGYPIVLKRIVGKSPWATRSGPSVSIARNRDELRSAFVAMRGEDQEPDVMLQEHIPGPPDSVCMFNAYFDSRSEPLVRFTGRKLRQRPPYTGATTLGVCAWNDEVDRDSRRLLREVDYRGIVDLGFRYDARDGRYKVLDVNPRIGATFRLFVGDNGMDVLRALYLDLTGQAVPATTQQEGRRWIVEPADLESSRAYCRDGVLTPSEWIRSLPDVREAAWWSADDPLPAAAMFAEISRRHLGRAARRLREHPPADEESTSVASDGRGSTALVSAGH